MSRLIKTVLSTLGALAALTAAALAAARLVPLPERLVEAPSTLVEYRDGTAAHVFTAPDGRWRVPVDLSRVDARYVTALLRLEDKRFLAHPGVDPLALLRAAWLNLRAGRRVSGGSTLTMQLVRVLEPRPRTLRSKAVETLRALQLELRMSKRQLLAAYLQYVPYGRNLEGVESAALAYFGHGAQHLSAAEMATLLAVPQAPARRFPRPENEAALRRGRDVVAERLLAEGALPTSSVGAAVSPEQVLAGVRATAVPTRLLAFPRAAPHLAQSLRQARGRTRIRTHLDPGLQRLAEQLLAREREGAARQGVHNAGLLLVDHRSSEVLVAVGNFDFWDAAHGGQISSLEAPRSPGSALKPFLYALGIERGLSGPEQRVPDLPLEFSGYSPRNFDGEFHGLVRLEDALSQSLNVPFVELLRQVGVEAFLSLLRSGGVRSLSGAPGHYGLSAAVGGLELTASELAGLYTALAQNGRYRPLRWTEDDDSPRPVRLFSPGAAHLTKRSLSLRDRPDFPERRERDALPPSIHWKTGTSFGFRDAWAAGSTRGHTGVVWFGNLDARGSRALTGASAAAPVLFDLLEAVEARRGGRLLADEPAPADLVSVEVCAFSGHLPTEACPHRTESLALRSAVPTSRCPFHVRVEVERASGLALGPMCRAGRDAEWRTFAVWPSRLKRHGRGAWLPLPEPPRLAPGCSDEAVRAHLALLSPPPGQTALLIPGLPPGQQRLALEADATGASELSWFVDGAYLGTAAPEETVWWTPTPGRHEVVVSGASGASARRAFDVAYRPN